MKTRWTRNEVATFGPNEAYVGWLYQTHRLSCLTMRLVTDECCNDSKNEKLQCSKGKMQKIKYLAVFSLLGGSVSYSQSFRMEIISLLIRKFRNHVSFRRVRFTRCLFQGTKRLLIHLSAFAARPSLYFHCGVLLGSRFSSDSSFG